MSIPAIAATQRLTKTAIDVLLKGADATQDDYELAGDPE